LKLQSILFCLIVTIALNAQVSNGLVFRCTFNNGEFKEELQQQIIKAYNAYLTEDRFGNSDKAIYLKGNGKSFINLGSSRSLKPQNGSISLWVNIHGIVGRGQGTEMNPIITTKSSEAEDCCEAYSLTFEMVKPYKFGASAQNSCEKAVAAHSQQNVVLGDWYHLVLVYNEDNMFLYINGKLDEHIEKNFKTEFLSGDSVLIGYFNNKKNVRYFMGSVDDIMIYDRLLTMNEVNSLYHAPDPNKNRVYMRWGLLILCIVVFAALVILFINYRVRKSVLIEKEKHALKARLIQLETRAIRSQMNPHFIFNSMNALQRFILENNKEKAYTYLIEFSTLLRKVLESSEAETISLKEEIDILNAYLKVEESRFENLFTYEVTCSVENIGHVHIPFMMIQPFAENAIWHGLLHKAGERFLSINFSDLDANRIMCIVDDNGIGRSFKEEKTRTVKKKSLAIDFTRQRLQLMQQATKIDSSLEIIDKKDDGGNSLGTTVKIIIPKAE